MSKWIRVAAAALSCVMIGALFSGCADKKAQKEEKTGLVNVRSEMYDAQYWASKYKNSSRILLSKEDIGKFNAQTIQSTLGMEDISYYQTSVNSTQLGSYIQEYVMPEGTLYSAQGEILYQMPEVTVDEDGNPVTGEDDSSYKDAILANRALDVMPSSNTAMASFNVHAWASICAAVFFSAPLFSSNVMKTSLHLNQRSAASSSHGNSSL